MAQTQKTKLETVDEIVEPVTVGDHLKNVRLKKKKDLRKVAEKLCIRVGYLEALEESRYDVFPGQVYAIGFLKNYAAYLKMPSEDLIDMYKSETAHLQPKPVVMPIPERRFFIPSGASFVMGFALIALVFLIWYFASYQKPASVTLPPIVEEEAIMTPVPLIMEQGVQSVSAPVARPSSVVAEVTSVPATVGGRIVIVAKEDVWLEIQDEDIFILNRILKKGERFSVPDDSADMMLKTGNAGGMEIYVDGILIKELGPKGVVRSRIKLDAEALKRR